MSVPSLSANGPASGINPALIVPGLHVPGAPLHSQGQYGVDPSCQNMWTIVEACQEKDSESHLRVNRDCLCERDIISSWITCHRCWDRVTYHSNGKRDLASSPYLIDDVTLSLVQSLCDRSTSAADPPDGDDSDLDVSVKSDTLEEPDELEFDEEESDNKESDEEESDNDDSDDDFFSDDEESDDDDSDEEDFFDDEDDESDDEDFHLKVEFDNEMSIEVDSNKKAYDEKDINKEESEEDDVNDEDDKEEGIDEEDTDEDLNEIESDEVQLSAVICADGVSHSHGCLPPQTKIMSEDFDLASENSIGASLGHSPDEAIIVNPEHQLGGFIAKEKPAPKVPTRDALRNQYNAKSNANTRVASVGLVVLGLLAAWAM
ncbi:unnamed protein product [Clonostachys byssicola]|uniref:Uncharacterized protein n=1 Tax=Clonostachys byssicola TaxID=160290 RepID=A0A9N9UTJ6_9HYPO|nr:unnamed protein product [Clonostachys byssicola]